MFEAFLITLLGAGLGFTLVAAATPSRRPPTGKTALALFLAGFGGAALVGALVGSTARGLGSGLAFGIVFVAVPHAVERVRRSPRPS